MVRVVGLIYHTFTPSQPDGFHDINRLIALQIGRSAQNPQIMRKKLRIKHFITPTNARGCCFFEVAEYSFEE
jgi:hypothetical protein